MPEQRIRFKRKTFIAWLLLVAVVLSLYLTYQDRIDVEWMRSVVHDNRFLIIPFYLLLLSVLGLAFIPSTPFAIAGVFLFDPTAAYILNLIGILTSSTIVFHFAGFLGLSTVFETRYPKRTEKVRKALDHKELPIIVGWSFFPVVPTDLIIYVASTLKIPLWKCLLGVLLGEGALNALYLFSVNAAL
ncbi:MAG: VTT domain-containing protein [Longimicrobiales bacterium]|nr:VTT domain-containing protein [Longimicrobiales bacterium]